MGGDNSDRSSWKARDDRYRDDDEDGSAKPPTRDLRDDHYKPRRHSREGGPVGDSRDKRRRLH